MSFTFAPLSDDHLALAKRYLEVTDSLEVTRQTMRHTVELNAQSHTHVMLTNPIARGALVRSGVSQQQFADAVAHASLDVLNRHMETLFERMIAATALHYSEEQLQAAVEFFGSEIGKSFVANQPGHIAELQQTSVMWTEGLRTEIEDAAELAIRRLLK